jgi:hypothetical protein
MPCGARKLHCAIDKGAARMSALDTAIPISPDARALMLFDAGKKSTWIAFVFLVFLWPSRWP